MNGSCNRARPAMCDSEWRAKRAGNLIHRCNYKLSIDLGASRPGQPHQVLLQIRNAARELLTNCRPAGFAHGEGPACAAVPEELAPAGLPLSAKCPGAVDLVEVAE